MQLPGLRGESLQSSLGRVDYSYERIPHEKIHGNRYETAESAGDPIVTRILIIDDNPDILQLYSRVLKQAGYEVVEAPNGKVGTMLYRDNPTDLVITDIVMPEKEGIETIRELRRDYPDAKIIAISGGGNAMASSTCLLLAGRLGAQRTLMKPIKIAELLQTVAEVVAS
jgi:CheY-like chemotaxis protein